MLLGTMIDLKEPSIVKSIVSLCDSRDVTLVHALMRFFSSLLVACPMFNEFTCFRTVESQMWMTRPEGIDGQITIESRLNCNYSLIASAIGFTVRLAGPIENPPESYVRSIQPIAQLASRLTEILIGN